MENALIEYMLFIILLIIFSGAFSISNFMPVADLQFRYGKCWMPLAAEAAEAAETGGSGYVATEYALLPPLDVQWVWYCHCLNPVIQIFYTVNYQKVSSNGIRDI